ncbi:MAG: insulinase family protein [Deltaproteobacteria bacterium]|nr:insulinase family protein [Deltaproteobacteria bacterium]
MPLAKKLAQLLLLFASPLVFAGSDLPRWEQKVVEYQLPNGMKFLLVSRGEAPTFNAIIRFRVGSMDEEPGKTGLAHLFEHMAFKGGQNFGTRNYKAEKPILNEIEKTGQRLSEEYAKGEKADPGKILEIRTKLRELHNAEEKHIVKEEISKIIEEAGGHHFNATTGQDMTSYFVSLPSVQLELWAKIESEAIFNGVLREFYEERDVVLEERRMRLENDPSTKLYEKLIATAFPDGHPYQGMTIGRKQDLLTLTRTDAERFFARHYTPANAVGAIVGRISIPEVKGILDRYFSSIPSKKAAPARSIPPLLLDKEKRVVLEEKAEPRLVVAYYKPTLPDQDDIIFDLIDQILSGGATSRLYKRLVLEKKIASGIDSYTDIPGSRLPNLFFISAEPVRPHTAGELEKGILEILGEFKEKGPTETELEQAKNKLKSQFIWGLKTNEGIASRLTYFEILGGWRYLTQYLSRVEGVTPEEIRKAAQKYLVAERRVVGELRKK